MSLREQITCFGGGRGQSTTLEAITLRHPRALTNSVCTSADDGSDSGAKRIIGQLLKCPIIPPGDIRRCMQPLASPRAQLWFPEYAEFRFPLDSGEYYGSDLQDVICDATCLLKEKHKGVHLLPTFNDCPKTQELLNYRFSREWGTMDRSCLGNTILAVAQVLYGPQEGVDAVREIVGIEGGLAPVSLVPGHINAVYGLANRPESRIKTNGESELDKIGEHPEYHPDMKPVDLSYLHNLPLNPRVVEFIEGSKKLVFSMGSWYTSLLANLMVDDCVGVIERAETQNVLIINLFSSKGEAHHLKTASEYVEDFKCRTQGAIRLHRVILNDSDAMRSLPKHTRDSYEAEEKKPVVGDEIERRKIMSIFPGADVRVLPLAHQIPGSTWVGHDIYQLGKNILAT